MRPFRLCMIVHSPVPSDVRVMAQASAALQCGFEVDIVATRAPGQVSEELLDEKLCAFRLPLEHARGTGLLAAVTEYVGFTVLAAAKVGMLHTRRRYDVVEVHNPPDFLMLAALVPRLLGAKTILDVHDRSPDMFHSRFGMRRGAPIADRLLRRIEWSATRIADYVLTVHESYRQGLISRGVPAEKITVVMNSVDERLLPSPSGRSRDEFRVVYHGTITPHYGVELLVDAAAAARLVVPNLRLEIYGDGDSVERVTARAAAAGLGGSFSHLSQLPRVDVLRRINGASVGVVPNLPTRLNRFALSTKLFEYVALGIPAVVADLPTLRAHFSPDEVVFFRAGDAEALARAIAEVAKDSDAVRLRAEAALRHYRREYRWETSAERFTAVLRRASGVPVDAAS
jgi:glycosyltransferase involved in cell wall biosynthesis